MEILKNEKGEDELGFKDIHIAEEYVTRASKMWHLFSGNNENNIVMQFWTDILKKMAEENYIKEEDLYKYSEREIVKMIEKCPDQKISNAFGIFKNSKEIGRSEEFVKGKYCVSVNSKKRYTNPLVLVDGQAKRIDKVSSKGKEVIDEIKNYSDTKYAYLDMSFIDR